MLHITSINKFHVKRVWFGFFFFSPPSQTDNAFSEPLPSSGVQRDVLFPCYHWNPNHWPILTFSALFLCHSTVTVSRQNDLGALANVLQFPVHKFSGIPWHELSPFCLATCNCKHCFGGLGLLSSSVSNDSTALKSPKLPRKRYRATSFLQRCEQRTFGFQEKLLVSLSDNNDRFKGAFHHGNNHLSSRTNKKEEC